MTFVRKKIAVIENARVDEKVKRERERKGSFLKKEGLTTLVDAIYISLSLSRTIFALFTLFLFFLSILLFNKAFIRSMPHLLPQKTKSCPVFSSCPSYFNSVFRKISFKSVSLFLIFLFLRVSFLCS